MFMGNRSNQSAQLRESAEQGSISGERKITNGKEDKNIQLLLRWYVIDEEREPLESEGGRPSNCNKATRTTLRYVLAAVFRMVFHFLAILMCKLVDHTTPVNMNAKPR